MSATLKTVTLGCKVNQYETELVREGLARIGYRDAADGEPADLCVVNTCTVTAEGDSKSRHAIRRLARENPQARIVVMGCYATRAPDELAMLPNVAEVLTDKREIPDLLGRFGVLDVPRGISRFGNRHRAYVKVQDGCLLRCSYCIIPYVRPQIHSRPPQDVIEEVRRLVDNGYREIVLTGVHLGHYGIEGNWNKPKDQWLRLSKLVSELARLPGDFRLRLSSIEATEVTRELIAVMAEFPHRIAPHLHICLQSGSDAVLRRMRRRWGSRLFVDRCRLVRESLDNPAITTDIIVGFPGESEADFRGHLPRGPRVRLLEDPHLPVQPSERDAGRGDAGQSAATGKDRAQPAAGKARQRASRGLLPQLARTRAERARRRAQRNAARRVGRHELPLCPRRVPQR
jgi:threonylcarbamoyladenosine tRNA methylthiotransferase MtaB